MSDASVYEYYADTDGPTEPSASSASESGDHGMNDDFDKENRDFEQMEDVEDDEKPDKISQANAKETEDLSGLLVTFCWEEILQKVQKSDKLVQELRRLSKIERSSVLMTWLVNEIGAREFDALLSDVQEYTPSSRAEGGELKKIIDMLRQITARGRDELESEQKALNTCGSLNKRDRLALSKSYRSGIHKNRNRRSNVPRGLSELSQSQMESLLRYASSKDDETRLSSGLSELAITNYESIGSIGTSMSLRNQYGV